MKGGNVRDQKKKKIQSGLLYRREWPHGKAWGGNIREVRSLSHKPHSSLQHNRQKESVGN